MSKQTKINSLFIFLRLYFILFICFYCFNFYAYAFQFNLKRHFQYQDLIEKPEKIDQFCHFSSEAQKLFVIEKFCSLDSVARLETNFLTSFCNFKDNAQALEIFKDYCIFKTPRSKQKILKKFCSFKTHANKKNYIHSLQNIIKVGKKFQAPINYNNEDERLKKRQDSLDTKIYHVAQEPHSEAAYHLGVIYGFSDCGMQNIKQANNYFQIAYDKPETFFMLAELYRIYNPKNAENKIYQFYQNAINTGISEGYYNLAIYIYKTLLAKNTPYELPLNFNYKTIFTLLREATKFNRVAQNDFAVMLYGVKDKKNQKNLIKIANSYLQKSAHEKFMPAIYNQIIILLSKKCTKTTQKLIQEKIDFLLTNTYPPAIKLAKKLNIKNCLIEN